MISYCDFLHFFEKKSKIFFLGIGGVSMSSLAFVSKNAGLSIAGYDKASSEVTDRLEAAGISVSHVFSPDDYKGVDAIVYTGAIHSSDPVLSYPRKIGIPEMTRAEFLGFLMKKSPNRIGVAGTHGKSTTTGFLASIFTTAGLDPTVMIGAEMASLPGGTYREGKGRDFIFEACEYQDSFLSFFPRIAVLLNVEHDHADYFPALEDVIRSFVKFADLSEIAVVCRDNPGAMEAAKRTGTPVKFYSLTEKCDAWCEDAVPEKGFYRFTLCTPEGKTEVRLRVPGLHNVSNALAAALAALLSGVGLEEIKKGLEAFTGIRRRFEYRGKCGEYDVFDDYAHHPDEIRATLTAARQLGYEKITVVFQSHTFTRTKAYWDGFVSSLSLADEVITADIYPAREEPIPGVTAENLAKAIPGGEYFGDLEAIAKNLRARREKGLLIVMGAGSIIRLTDLLLTERHGV